MNFEERKAEIFRRGEAKIAQRKRKKRIILGAVIPVALVAVLALPVSQMLGGKAEESAPQQMNSSSLWSQANKELLASENIPTPTNSPETIPEIDPEFSCDNTNSNEAAPQPELTDAPITSGDIPDLPPAIAITTCEGESISPNLVGYVWPCEKDGSIAVMENAIFYRTVVSTNSQYPALELDFGGQTPLNVVVECWDLAGYSSDGIVDGQALSAALSVPFGENRDGKPYGITAKSGDYLYQITITWPQGTARYAFRAVVE